MADRTRAALIEEALFEIGVAQAGQPVPAETAKRVDDKLDNILETLAAREIAYIANPSVIPGASFNPLAVIVGYAVAGSFSIVGQELVELAARATDAESTLRELSATAASFAPQNVSYF